MASAEYMRHWNKTPYGRAYKAWAHITERVENKDGKHPNYANVKLLMTRQEFMKWAVPRYVRWLRKNPDGKPSIHRMKDPGHYKLSNLKIISYQENTRLSKRNRNVHAPRGQAWCGDCKAYKSRKAFNRNRYGSNGLHWYCRNCEHKRAAKRLALNPEYYRRKCRLKMRRLRAKWRNE